MMPRAAIFRSLPLIHTINAHRLVNQSPKQLQNFVLLNLCKFKLTVRDDKALWSPSESPDTPVSDTKCLLNSYTTLCASVTLPFMVFTAAISGLLPRPKSLFISFHIFLGIIEDCSLSLSKYCSLAFFNFYLARFLNLPTAFPVIHFLTLPSLSAIIVPSSHCLPYITVNPWKGLFLNFFC